MDVGTGWPYLDPELLGIQGLQDRHLQGQAGSPWLRENTEVVSSPFLLAVRQVYHTAPRQCGSAINLLAEALCGKCLWAIAAGLALSLMTGRTITL